jgi:hypothetical protein
VKFHSAASFDYQPPGTCYFGITEAALGISLAAGIGETLGVGATAGGLIAGGLEGAAGGALLSGITGGDPLTGALGGALTGGAVGGIGAAGLGTAAEVAGGAAAGAAGSAITGGNILLGAAGGGATGLVAGVGGSGSTSTPGGTSVASMPATGGGPSAASTTAGIAPAGGAPVDLTANFAGTGAAGDAPFGSAPAFGGTTAGVDSGMGGTATGGGTDWFSKLADPKLLMAAAPLAVSMLSPGSTTGQAGVQQLAGEAGTQARTLETFQTTGTLPGGLQQVVDAQKNAAIAKTKSTYGKMGLSGSTMESQALEQVGQETAASVAMIANNLAKEGRDWAALAQEWNQLMQTQTAQDTAFNNALGKFAAGLAGSFIGGDKTGTTG